MHCLPVLCFLPFILSASVSWAAPPIYRCEREGVTIFADRPCEPEAQRYVPAQQISTFAAPVVSPSPSLQPVRKQRNRSSAKELAALERQKTECARILASLRDIRSRMRAGYGAAEGERLRARQARLNERRRAQRCT